MNTFGILNLALPDSSFFNVTGEGSFQPTLYQPERVLFGVYAGRTSLSSIHVILVAGMFSCGPLWVVKLLSHSGLAISFQENP